MTGPERGGGPGRNRANRSTDTVTSGVADQTSRHRRQSTDWLGEPVTWDELVLAGHDLATLRPGDPVDVERCDHDGAPAVISVRGCGCHVIGCSRCGGWLYLAMVGSRCRS